MDRSFLPAVILALAPALLLAQAHESATSIAGPHVDVGAEYSLIHPDYWGRNLYMNGATGLVEYNLQAHHFGGGLSGEYRMLTESSYNHRHETSMLFGPRMVYRVQRFYPYVRYAAGMGDFAYETPPNQSGDHFVTAISFGTDYQLSPRLFVRLIDFQQQFWYFGVNGLTPYSYNFGLRYRIR